MDRRGDLRLPGRPRHARPLARGPRPRTRVRRRLLRGGGRPLSPDPADALSWSTTRTPPGRCGCSRRSIRRDLERELILSHELVHFLQHQAFPALMDADPFWKSQDDATAALQAALEGDALHYGFASLEIEPPAAEDLREALEEEDRQRSHGALAEAPALLRLTVAFPYAHGYGLSLREGRALLASPPASTEQVLHPERAPRALPGDRPRRAASRASGGLPRSLRRHAGRAGPLRAAARPGRPGEAAAWEGWDGDRWVAADCGGDRELVWLTAWDSETDAAEFAASYARIAPAVAERAAMASPPAARVVGARGVDRDPDARASRRASRRLRAARARRGSTRPARALRVRIDDFARLRFAARSACD